MRSSFRPRTDLSPFLGPAKNDRDLWPGQRGLCEATATKQGMSGKQVRHGRSVSPLIKRDRGVYGSRCRASKTPFMCEKKSFQMSEPFCWGPTFDGSSDKCTCQPTIMFADTIFFMGTSGRMCRLWWYTISTRNVRLTM